MAVSYLKTTFLVVVSAGTVTGANVLLWPICSSPCEALKLVDDSFYPLIPST